MFVIRRLPALLAILMLGALAMRLGLPIVAVAPFTVVLLVLLFFRQATIQTVFSFLLYGGSLAWVGMIWLRVHQRLADGLPWIRLSIILGAVALFTATSAYLLRDLKSPYSTH